jgi:hypothetical protein
MAQPFQPNDQTDMQTTIDGLETEVSQSQAAAFGFRTSTNEAAQDLVRLVDAVKPLLARAHAALMFDGRSQPLLDELIAATLDMEAARVKWETVANKET